jgi:hypothetical protein
MVSTTPPGGVLRDLTSSMSAFLRSLRHFTASSRAGIAYSIEYPIVEYPIIEYPIIEYPIIEYKR